MFGRTAGYSLMWDFAVAETVDGSQRWVLSAMQKHGQELVTMLWRILGNEQDVCDAYQSTFLQLAHYPDRRKPRHVKAYIFRTASNAAVSMLRRKTAERKRLSNAIAAAADKRTEAIRDRFRAGDGSPADEFDLRSLQETLRGCMAKLPEHLRNVIALRDLAELSYAQVGRILGITPATARVYRCKAVQLLAVWMSRESEDAK